MEDNTNIPEYPPKPLTYFESAAMIEFAKIYDMLALIGMALGETDRVTELIEMHRGGQFYSPQPAIAVEEVPEGAVTKEYVNAVAKPGDYEIWREDGPTTA